MRTCCSALVRPAWSVNLLDFSIKFYELCRIVKTEPKQEAGQYIFKPLKKIINSTFTGIHACGIVPKPMNSTVVYIDTSIYAL